MRTQLKMFTWVTSIVLSGMLFLPGNITYAQNASISPPAREQFVVNPSFDPEVVPGAEQPLDVKDSQERVKDSFEAIDVEVKKACRKNKVFRVNSGRSSLKVTSFKNFKIPVVGKFNHFDGYLFWTSKEGKTLEPEAFLWIDVTSWDSGVPDRDHRVRKYLLAAQEPKNSVSTLEMEYEGGSVVTGLKETTGTLKFRGKSYKMKARSQAVEENGTWTVRSQEPLRLDAEIPTPEFLELMKLCNHESLTATVDLEWSLVFEPVACSDLP